MRRRNIFLSPIGFFLTLALFLGLGLSLWHNGAQAFSPGALSAKSSDETMRKGFASHADFEAECEYCHQPLKTIQADLCVVCHTEIADQLDDQDSLHSQFEAALRCAECHSDHQGRDFDPLQDALDDFDHSLAAFSLAWHQVNYDLTRMDCSACHLEGQKGYRVSERACAECHAGHEMEFMTSHILDFSERCLECHDGVDRMAGFDHSATTFPLTGAHAPVRCAECHVDSQFESTPRECRGCHAEPPAHLGLFSLDCERCHTPQAWKPATLDGNLFDHTAQTGFSLARHGQDYAGEALSCRGCHPVDFQAFDPGTCVICHSDDDPAFMEKHQEQFGSTCLDCHDGVDRLSNFDHASFFPLEGKHAEIECEGCHVDRVFAGTPIECVQCHAEPEIHAGFFGLNCQDCHTSDAWSPAQLRVHTFPLDHGDQEETACQVCHLKTYVEYSCYGCHEHQPELIAESHLREDVTLEELPKCVECHPLGQ